MSKEYSQDLQKLFLEMMLQDRQSFIRVQNIYNPENFDRSLRETAKFLKDYSVEYKNLPTIEQIKATTGVELKTSPELEAHKDWFLTEFEGFTKQKEGERAVLACADLLEKGQNEGILKIMKAAVEISLTKDMGTDYFEDPKARLERYFNNGYKVSTGWPSLDALLYGGFSKGELNIFAGGSGSGKSLFMMNIAINWLTTGLNGVYISLELSEDLSSLRTDAMIANMGTKDIRRNLDDAVLKLSFAKKKMGKYRIKALPAQSNVNDIRSYINEMQIQTGMKVDFMMVDYLDLLMPVSAKVSANDLFVKDKYVSEELRNLSEELDILFVTASQLNRSAVEEVEFDHSHISGGISKINTADNVFGIFTSRAMKERGRYQLQCMKNRSGAGTGKKVDLDYDIETMRITDPGEDAQGTPGTLRPQVNSVMSSIKAKSTVEGEGPAKFERATGTAAWEKSSGGAGNDGEAQSTKLKQMLAGIKSSSASSV
jgi:KaiC/GvpD/RAD55 family RecA-like ATPase